MRAPKPEREHERLDSLRAYEVLDTLPEQAYDDIVFLASQITDTPIALISLVDENRQCRGRLFRRVHQLDARGTEFGAQVAVKQSVAILRGDVRALHRGGGHDCALQLEAAGRSQQQQW